jgi:phosphoglycolate phosphatase
MLETDATPDATVMVGDTTYDIAMARAVGVAAIGVAWGYHDVAALTDAGAHLIIERFDDLPDAIEEVLATESRAA